MSRPLEDFSDRCAAGCGRAWMKYHKQCNLTFCLECHGKHTCSPEPDRSHFYPKKRSKKSKAEVKK